MSVETGVKQHKLGIFSLVMIAAAFIVSVRNLPMMAETGLQMIFFSLIAVGAFLMPVALVAAELATGWPEEGGIYAWVKEAFGERWGFVAVWLLWFQMIIGMTGILSFIGGMLAYVIDPALANNKTFLVCVILAVYWGATFLNLGGMKASSRISTICFISGVFIPGVLMILLGILYLIQGNTPQIDLSFTMSNIVPDMKNIHNLVLLFGFIFVFSGMEVSAVHAGEVENPQKNYPLAILLAGVLLVGINVIGSMAVAVVVPKSELSLVSGLMEAFKAFFGKFNLKWMTPFIALMAGIGATGQVSTWIVGPVKGLLATSKNGDIPPYFQKVNKSGMPKRLLILQASLVSLFGLMYAVIPNINTTFSMLLAMTILLYLVMYVLMFLSAIKLRYKEPDVVRAYKVPGGNIGMWVIAGIGLLTSFFTFYVGVLPPDQIKVTDPDAYVRFMVIGTIVMTVIPLIIFQLRKPGWKQSS